ncbi:MAG TPA: sialate O-acetylesterase [Polyangiaceae bacterium]|nr:sialate O-acetylesterase [Polyangiaceae bacterium]
MKHWRRLVPALFVAALAGCSSKDEPNNQATGSGGAHGGNAAVDAGMTGVMSGGPSGGALSSGGIASAGGSGAVTGGAGTGALGGGVGGMSAASGMSSGGANGAGAGNGGRGDSGGGGAGTGGALASGGAEGGIGAGGASAGMAGNLAGASGSSGATGGADPKFLIFLLIGQSNMVGQPQPQAQDLEQDPRIKVLAYDDCSNVNRKYNQWYTAYPPLHQCDAGVGPGDYFAKTLIQTLPDGYTIGLVPLGVNGAPIDVFRKNVPRPGWELPPDNHWETGYEWILSRALEAQKVGVIRGLLFHQGESNSGEPEWVDHVKGLATDLRTDLGIGDVPFLAGELYYDGCCKEHNALVKQVTDSLANAFLVSASGLKGTDQYHFDLAGQRELGKRYGMAMQGALTVP